MANAPKKNILPLPAHKYSNQQRNQPNDVSQEITQNWLGGRKGFSVASIAQLTFQKEAFGRYTTRNDYFKQ
jgi:hypothetical protein